MIIGNNYKLKGIAIDTASSVAGDIYASGAVSPNHAYFVSNTYNGVGDDGPEGIFFAQDQAFVLPTAITPPDTIDAATLLCPLYLGSGLPGLTTTGAIGDECSISTYGVWTNYPTLYDIQWLFKPTGGAYSVVSISTTYTPQVEGLIKLRIRARNGYGYQTTDGGAYTENGYIESPASSIS